MPVGLKKRTWPHDNTGRTDRILFGTDFRPEEPMYRNWFRWLETEDEHFEYWNHPDQGRWRIYGLELPREVLEKIYGRNAERVLSTIAAQRRKDYP